MAAKLKVYATRIGFHDAVVAAPNQKAALKAWDIREDLFAQGTAASTDDPQAVKAATAAPGVVLRRPAGSDKAFCESPEAPDAPSLKPAAKAKADKAAAAKPARPPPDRRPLEAAEKALADLDAEEKRATDDIVRRRRDLDAEARDHARAFSTRRKALQRERDRALRVYQREGNPP